MVKYACKVTRGVSESLLHRGARGYSKVYSGRTLAPGAEAWSAFAGMWEIST